MHTTTIKATCSDIPKRIDEREPHICAFVDRTLHARLMDEALKLDTAGDPVGPLHGVPVAVKEIFDVAGLRCSWGTPIHRDRVPATDAHAVARLRAAGAIIVGTAVSTEYAIAAAGPTRNPHDSERTPGGSSSGSAAAVAAGMVPLALGSQTVGSIVRPAIYCGVYGFKPSHGAISTGGAMTLSPMLDDVGILARTVGDITLALTLLVDETGDSGTHAAHFGSQADAWQRSPEIVVIDAPWSGFVAPASRLALRRARTALERFGANVRAEVVPADFARTTEWLQTILCHDIAVQHGVDRDHAGEQMSDRLRELIDRGRSIDSSRYLTAIHRAMALKDHLTAIVDGGAVLLAPATEGVAPRLNEGTGFPTLQGPYTLAGLAVLAVPTGQIDGLPIGVQLATARGREGSLFAAARAIEADRAQFAAG